MPSASSEDLDFPRVPPNSDPVSFMTAPLTHGGHCAICTLAMLRGALHSVSVRLSVSPACALPPLSEQAPRPSKRLGQPPFPSSALVGGLM